MAEKVKINRSEDRPIVVFDEPSERRLPGRDLVDEDDEDDVEADVAPKSIEIIEDNSNSHIRPRKSSLLVNPTSHRHQARKRSVTFDPVDVAAIIQPPPKTPTDEEDECDAAADYECEKMEEESLNALSSPISIEQLRLRVSEELPETPPPRGSKRVGEARPPTPPGASHRVKYPKTPPPTPMDTKYI